MTTTLRWAVLAASLVIGLAALLRMAGPAAAGHDDLTGAIRLPQLVTATVLMLFAVAGLVFLVGLARRIRSRRRSGQGEGMFSAEDEPPPPWMRTVTQILSLLNVAILAYLVWRGVIPLADLMTLGYGIGSAVAPALPQEPPVAAPFLVTWTFGVLALMAGLGALALALWVAFSDRVVEWWERRSHDAPPPPADAAEESLEDLRAEPDARRAIIRCYRRFQRVAAGSGVERKPWHTPMEFMREALGRLPVPRGTVPTLTGLFELARFSHRALGPPERDRALGALDEITAAIENRGDDVAAR